METQEEVKAYLDKIRKTIEESEATIAQAELRIAETDRLLASQGLTRDEVANWRPTKEQRLFVNAELRRRGLPEMEEEEESFDFSAATEEIRMAEIEPGSDDIVAERQKKFGNFMQAYRL